MSRDRIRLALVFVLLLAVVLMVVFSLQTRRQAAPSPTVDVAGVQTRAVRAFIGELTGTALAEPTQTATDTPVPTTAAASSEATASTSSASPTPSCYRLKFLQDVTIPDNTILTPAQVFTKTWQVQNSGLCAWRPGFQLILIGGAPMGGSPYVLPVTANPGAKLELSVKMVAPTNQTGIIQGTWRMSDQGGNLFGDSLTVVIVIGVSPGSGSTVAPTATP